MVNGIYIHLRVTDLKFPSRTSQLLLTHTTVMSNSPFTDDCIILRACGQVISSMFGLNFENIIIIISRPDEIGMTHTLLTSLQW